MIKNKRQPSLLLILWALLVVIFILGPFVMVLLVSLTPLDYISLPQDGLSLRWYGALLERPAFLQAALNSLLLALASSLLALVLGLPAAMALARRQFPGRQLILGALMSPLFVPLILSALAILSTYSTWGWSDPVLRIFLAHTAIILPYVLRTLSASLLAFDPRQELAARNLGAGPLQTFVLITLPQIAPGLFAATLFAFIISFDDVGLSLFLTGTGFTTLPVQLFSYASYNNDPSIAAVSVVMVLLSFAVVVLVERFFGLEKMMR